MTITIDLLPDLETQVRRAARQEGLAPEAYINKVLSKYLPRQSVAVSDSEAALLQQINAGLAEKKWERLAYLRRKMQDDELSNAEQQELVAIADAVEAANVQRIQALLQLAELRNTTIERLMDELAIRPPAYA